MVIHVGIYDGVDSWIACNQNDGSDISSVAKSEFGAEEDRGVDDDVWGPTQSVDNADCHNHFCDAFPYSYNTLEQVLCNKLGKLRQVCWSNILLKQKMKEVLKGPLVEKHVSYFAYTSTITDLK